MTATLESIMAAVLETREETRALRLLIEARNAGPLATDADVDGDQGDPIVKFDPAGFRGPSEKGKKLSRCSVAFLDALAVALDNIAAKDRAEKKEFRGKPAWVYSARTAARARRWAYRKRRGWAPPEEAKPVIGAGGKPLGTTRPNPFAPKKFGPLGVAADSKIGDSFEDWELEDDETPPADEDSEEEPLL